MLLPYVGYSSILATIYRKTWHILDIVRMVINHDQTNFEAVINLIKIFKNLTALLFFVLFSERLLNALCLSVCNLSVTSRVTWRWEGPRLPVRPPGRRPGQSRRGLSVTSDTLCVTPPIRKAAPSSDGPISSSSSSHGEVSEAYWLISNQTPSIVVMWGDQHTEHVFSKPSFVILCSPTMMILIGWARSPDDAWRR